MVVANGGGDERGGGGTMDAKTLMDLAAKGGTGEVGYFELDRAFDAVKALRQHEIAGVARDMGILMGLPSKARAISAIRGQLYGPADARSRRDS